MADYFVEGDEVLENKLNIIDPTKLKEIEEALVAREGMCIIEEDLRPDAYDFAFLKYLHRRLFGKIYSFAGQVRTVNIAKMDSNIPFCYADFIEQEAERIFVELRRRNFLVGLLRDEFADSLAELAMDLNALHPFREGNGRTIRLYLQLLSRNAGYSLDYGSICSYTTTQNSSQYTNQSAQATVTGPTVLTVGTDGQVPRRTYNLTVTAGSNTSGATGSGTYRYGQTVTASVTKATNTTCTSYAAPTWTKNSGATGSLNSTSGTSVTYTMGTTNDTVTATATRTNVEQTITFNMGTGVSSILFGGESYTNGQTASVTCGTKDIVGVYSGNYWFSSWSAIAGTFDNTSYFHARYTVDGPATITLSSRTLTNRGSMQNFTASQCRSYASSDPVLVTDSRDNNTYAVRYINGDCWMTQNLRLSGGRTLTSANSNVASSWYFPDTSLTSGNSYTAAYSIISSNDSYGGYYNYCAASAGTNCQTSSIYDTPYDTTYDICPKGWRLPTYSEQSGITGTSYVSAFSPVYSGAYYNGSLSSTGSFGYWWSSTAYSSGSQYGLYYTSGRLNTVNVSRRNGFSVRCVRSS